VRKHAHVTLVAVLVAIVGCGGSDEEQERSPRVPGSPELPPPPPRSFPPPPPAKPTGGRVPPALVAIKSNAEDLVDLARERKRAKVVATATRLTSLARDRGGPTLEKAKVSDVLIEALEAQAQSLAGIASHGDFLQIALAANQISGLMPHIYEYYSGPLPPDVLKLDYLEREAQLRPLAREPALTRRAVDQLSSTWNELRSAVAKAGGGQAAARYSDHVEKMQELVRAFDRRAIRNEATRGLRLINELERVFRRK
jgi:hypothetical protein